MVPLIIMAIVAIRVATAISPSALQWLKKTFGQLSRKLSRQRINSVFDEHFIEVKSFYLRKFKTMPSISFIGSIDAVRAFNQIKGNSYGGVKKVYQRTWYNWQMERLEFSKTIFILEGSMMVRLGDDWAEILFNEAGAARAEKMIADFKLMKAPAKEQDYEINIITLNNQGLDLKQLAIHPTALDLDLYYNDDFKAVDRTIRERLEKENDKGIILLHGLPGTGKTTYLRHLIGSMKKKVLFVSPAVAGNLMNPEFIDLLIDNSNAVLVIEDAENIIMDRKYNSGSSVSNLLNISDGLLSDCLNVQIICTFNSALNLIDSALLRKGRLIAKYEFGKLEMSKAAKLSAHLGLNQQVDKAMTLAEITHPEETHYSAPAVHAIGFRRQVIEN